MKYSILLFFICISSWVSAQENQTDSIPQTVIDTVREVRDIEEIEMYAKKFVPRRASLYAAILPGAGQIYNRKYWKLPLVYGGFIALGLTVDFYNGLYQQYRSDIFGFLEDPNYSSSTGANLDRTRTLADNARRDRDFWIAMTGIFYLLQIADAHIDAHLKEFELNPNLQISFEPSVDPTYFAGYVQGFSSGISIKLKF
ncbi:DUF5683 domain-containing protein [Fulvivirga sedimenti]|jgi:hypothetical protein|uniref:DUF5683 domain-containing protein n=1 Tax=Fulvivirga sedimenti TaxID=2879465 RepID=A0A9X1HN26_9BACT|nr:DUF5683 domain-containing protein [Fulvivirga sedimenti]MCA6073602.1 DUF5683 domain-containing protein [Fulvivirga sedimenti]